MITIRFKLSDVVSMFFNLHIVRHKQESMVLKAGAVELGVQGAHLRTQYLGYE